MGEYSSAVALVKRLINKKGRSDVGITRSAPGVASNTARPWKVDIAGSDIIIATGIHAVILDIKQVQGDLGQQGLELSLRTLVPMQDSLTPSTTAIGYFIPDEFVGFTIRVGDLITTAGQRYTVLRCEPLQPGNEIVMYVANLKE